MGLPHATRPIKVWVDVDIGIAKVFAARPKARINATALSHEEVRGIYRAMEYKTRRQIAAKFRKNLESGA
jgi:hypothetical protein